MYMYAHIYMITKVKVSRKQARQKFRTNTALTNSETKLAAFQGAL